MFIPIFTVDGVITKRMILLKKKFPLSYNFSYLFYTGCHEKKLLQDKCPSCNTTIDNPSNSCYAQLLVKSLDKQQIFTIFRRDIYALIALPALDTFSGGKEGVEAFIDAIVCKLPVEARATIDGNRISFDHSKWYLYRTNSTWVMTLVYLNYNSNTETRWDQFNQLLPNLFYWTWHCV